MRKLTRLAAVLSILGTLAPVAAYADVGTSIYQPGPIIAHAKPSVEKNHVSNGRVADGRAVHGLQLKALRHDHAYA